MPENYAYLYCLVVAKRCLWQHKEPFLPALHLRKQTCEKYMYLISSSQQSQFFMLCTFKQQRRWPAPIASIFSNTIHRILHHTPVWETFAPFYSHETFWQKLKTHKNFKMIFWNYGMHTGNDSILKTTCQKVSYKIYIKNNTITSNADPYLLCPVVA